MEAHHLPLERRRKSSEVSEQGWAWAPPPQTTACSLALTRPFSCRGPVAAGPCAAPSAPCGLHQPGLLHLQLLLCVGELQTGGAQEGLQRGEDPRWEGGCEGSPVLRQLVKEPHTTRAAQWASAAIAGPACGARPGGEPSQEFSPCSLHVRLLKQLFALGIVCACVRQREKGVSSRRSLRKVTCGYSDL